MRGFCLMICLLVLSACGQTPAGRLNEQNAAGRFIAIVDARGDTAGGQIHIVDTVTHKVVTSLEREAPDSIFTRDGSTLLLGSNKGLEWIDTTTWKPTKRLKTASHTWWKLFPEVTQYALNPDGHRLHLVGYHPDGPAPGGAGRLAVQSIDLAKGSVLTPVVNVPPCVSHLLVPSPGIAYNICLSGPLTVLDLESGKTIRTVNVGPVRYRNGVAFGYGGGSYSGFAGEFLRKGTSAQPPVLIVTARGGLQEVDPERGEVRALGDLGLIEEQVIPHRQVALSPDGKRLYVGIRNGTRCDPGCSANRLTQAYLATTIRVFDTATWKMLREYPAKHPFMDLAVTTGGQELVTTSPAQRSIAFVNEATGQEVALLENVGREPSLIIGQPRPR